MSSEKIQIEEGHALEKDISGDTIMRDYENGKPHAHEVAIPSNAKEAQKLLDKISNDLNVIHTGKTQRDSLKQLVEDLYFDSEEKNKEFGELTDQIKKERQNNKVLDNDILESQSRRTRLELIHRNQKNVDILKEIAYGQMVQITRLRNQMAREIASGNNKLYSRRIYELEKIPSAWNNCSTFDEAKVSLIQKNDELTIRLRTEAAHMPQYNQKVVELEKLVALRAVEAQLHQINQKEILEEINKIWKENSQWWSNDVEPAFADIKEFGEIYQEQKREKMEAYEDIKQTLKNRYGLEDWS